MRQERQHASGVRTRRERELYISVIFAVTSTTSLIPVRSISSMNFLADALLLFSSTRQMANIIDSNLVLKLGR